MDAAQWGNEDGMALDESMPSRDRAAEPRDGRRLIAGRYALGRVLGTGSSAVVHRARDLRSGDEVAVKRFHSGSSPHDLRQQRREMTVLARLDHPGLVGLHDGGTEDGRPFVVTDLVEGPTLAQRISAGPIAPGAVRTLGRQLAEALAHVHSGGIVHRDVKPANVLLDGVRPRLADFGIARALDGTAATATGCVVGTAAYLAPEQVRGEAVGPPVDVYALGLVLLEALTGRREYPGLAVESATARLHRCPAVPRGLPGGLGELLDAMTRSDPRQRPTAAQVAAVLAADPARRTRRAPAGLRHGRHRLPCRGQRRPAASRLTLMLLTGVVAVLAGASPSDPPAPVSVPDVDQGAVVPGIPGASHGTVSAGLLNE
ncbi:serine/threonine-protein kinase [Pseudonocardia xinjiangensis]|uniref:non-specific serine/threonine protein kinase n=1 Tax=Pseudonocardia xinjiangensis TaxID=75289 RepID=A0ABX1RAH7_9PSEU|nr:serine/threonine-protein kinase [Pseudonocardia xinjiangensis]NMH77385.1 protein kinase [Pseudonocardia xinjiangensis]